MPDIICGEHIGCSNVTKEKVFRPLAEIDKVTGLTAQLVEPPVHEQFCLR